MGTRVGTYRGSRQVGWGIQDAYAHTCVIRVIGSGDGEVYVLGILYLLGLVYVQRLVEFGLWKRMASEL